MKKGPLLQNGSAPYQKAVAARFIHIDFPNNDNGAVHILDVKFDGQFGEEPWKARRAIINVWRPIKPISEDPDPAYALVSGPDRCSEGNENPRACSPPVAESAWLPEEVPG